MPVTAAWLPDVGPRDPHPLVLGRRRQHLPQQLAVALLQLVALAQCDASLRDPLGKGVSHALQLAEIGDSRRSRQGRNPGVYRESWKCLAREARQLPLEAPDLAPQLGAREPLVASDSELI